jgi:hypothetical protein
LDDAGRELPVDRVLQQVEIPHVGSCIVQQLLGKRPFLPYLKENDE